MDKIKVMMVDDEPLIRKLVKMEMNSRGAVVESGDENGSVERRVEMVETFADGPSLMVALERAEPPDYLLVDMEFSGEPTGGLLITRRVHERFPQVRVIIFSGRFDLPDGFSDETLQGQLRVVMEALALGASAFVSKNAVGGFSIENILRAVACLERGERFYFNYPLMLSLKEAAARYLEATGGHDPSMRVSDDNRRLLLLEAAGYTAAEISDMMHLSDKAVQQQQKELSQRLGIVNKSAARVAKAMALGLISPSEVEFLPR